MSVKVVLITGTSSGIGEAFVNAFSKQSNIKVYATARKLDSIKHLESKNVKTIQLDVCDKQSIKNAVNKIISDEGKIDILINNAGINYYAPAIELPDEDARRLFNTNFFGVIDVTKEVATHMIEKHSGLIANVGSIVAEVSTPFASMYCSSKAAIHSWSDALRMELAPFNINVTICMPGAIKSEIANNAQPQLEKLLQVTIYQQIKDYISKRGETAQARGIPASEYAEATVAQLLKSSPPSRYAYGPLSFQFRLLSFLPSFVSDFMFSQKFGLSKLKSLLSTSNRNKQD